MQISRLRVYTVVLILAVAGVVQSAVAADFEVVSAVEPASAAAGDTVNLKVTFTVAPGIHLYKDKISFDWTETDGLVPGEPVYPTATTIPDPLDQLGFQVIEVYDGSVTVTVPMVVDSKSGAAAAVKATVHYQGCTDTMCFLPMQYTPQRYRRRPNPHPLGTRPGFCCDFSWRSARVY